MKKTPKKYSAALMDITQGKDKKEIEKIIKDFIRVLILNNDFAKSQEVIAEYEKLADSKNNIVRAKVTSAKELENDSLNFVRDFIKEVTKAEEVVLEKEVRKELIGGLVIRYGDKVIDYSLQARINDLKIKLIK
jgi:F-type H+-transporting ATPase subunit delta